MVVKMKLRESDGDKSESSVVLSLWDARLCWAPTSFQLTTELYPQELRQHGLALSHVSPLVCCV